VGTLLKWEEQRTAYKKSLLLRQKYNPQRYVLEDLSPDCNFSLNQVISPVNPGCFDTKLENGLEAIKLSSKQLWRFS